MSVVVRNPDTPGAALSGVRYDAKPRAGVEGSVPTSVTSCDSGLGQTNWLLSNQVYCAEGLGLELHGRLFEARASRGGRPRSLVL